MKNKVSIVLTVIFIFYFSEVVLAERIQFSKEEEAIIQSLSSRNFSQEKYSGNRVPENTTAIALGKKLFFDPRLSGDNTVSCATCHKPQQGWGSREALTHIRPGFPAKRHTPHLYGVKYNRWFFWDGRADSLWMQALMPIEDPSEMGGDRTNATKLILEDKQLRENYEKVFGKVPDILTKTSLPHHARPVTGNSKHSSNLAWKSLSQPVQDAVNLVYVNIGKAIASFEETIVAIDTPFDRFADQLQEDTSKTEYAISTKAMRGLKHFISKGSCISCHFGPNFSDGEFHHSFLQPFSLKGDLGRYSGISKLLDNPFNGSGKYSDINKKAASNKLNYVYKNVAFRGQFKTPSLRNVALTYPYMHTGEFKNLKEVLDYYTSITKRIEGGNHENEEILLKSITLSETEKLELIAFLETITNKE